MLRSWTGDSDRRASPASLTLVGACCGNAVEWYDFAVYGAFAPILAAQFFPVGTPGALAATFAILATAFLARPVGAVVLGRYADRWGRRPVITAIITLMSVATASIALLPTWSSIGVLAPTELVGLRLIQGVANGGETPGSMVFLIESAPPGRRGWYGGCHLASIAMGLSAGYGTVAVLAAVLSDEALSSWGWRTAFLLAAPLGLVGRLIRRRLGETPHFTAIAAPRSPRLRTVLRGRGPAIRGAFFLVGVLSLPFNLWFVFLPVHAVADGSSTLATALLVSLGGLGAAMLSAPLAGDLSDRVGRRPVLIAATSGLAVFAVPGFALAWSGSPAGWLVSNLVVGALTGAMAVSAFVTELFPAPVRVTGSALTYGLATALFGGTAPLLATVVVGLDAAWLLPTYVAVIAVLGLAAALRVDETAFRELS